jgi:hypothetical protein
VAPDPSNGLAASAPSPRDGQPEFIRLFHKLNNQLGIILANAELLESRLEEGLHKARAGQVAASALDAIGTTQELRRLYALAPPAPAHQDASEE